jgi:hypothetical protein
MTVNVHKKCFLIKHLDVIYSVVGIENGKYLKCGKRMEQVLLLKWESLKTIVNNNHFVEWRYKK